MSGSRSATCSPSSTVSTCSTPWVAGWCGPMLMSIVFGSSPARLSSSSGFACSRSGRSAGGPGRSPARGGDPATSPAGGCDAGPGGRRSRYRRGRTPPARASRRSRNTRAADCCPGCPSTWGRRPRARGRVVELRQVVDGLVAVLVLLCGDTREWSNPLPRSASKALLEPRRDG